jgi:hypothetical protein
MLSFSISYSDSLKFPYFTESTEKVDRGVSEKEGDFMDKSYVWRLSQNKRLHKYY